MHIVLAVFGVVFGLLGFAGFFFGGLPTIVFWILAAVCIGIAWRIRPNWQRRREERNLRRRA